MEKMKLKLTRNGEPIETASFGIELPNGEFVKIRIDSMGDLDINMSNDESHGFIRPRSGNSFEICFIGGR
jgi:hypothetical protein